MKVNDVSIEFPHNLEKVLKVESMLTSKVDTLGEDQAAQNMLHNGFWAGIWVLWPFLFKLHTDKLLQLLYVFIRYKCFDIHVCFEKGIKGSF